MLTKRSSYCILLHQDKIGIVQYPSGYCLVGGSAEDNENEYQCLLREVEEEIGGVEVFKSLNTTRLLNDYTFFLKAGVRKNLPEHTEIHSIFLCLVDDPTVFEYKEEEKNGNLVRISVEEFLSDKVSPFEEYKEYLKNNFIPLFEK